MTSLRFSPVRATLGFSFLAAALSAQSQLLQGQVVLADGDPCPVVPGTTVGLGLLGTGTFAGLSDNPVIDLNGNIFFRARLSGAVTLNATDRVLLLGRTRETLQLVLRGGDPDPTGLLGVGTIIGTPTGGNGLNTGALRISQENRYLMFSVALAGPNIIATGTAATGNNANALLVGQPGALTVLAQRAGSFTTPSNAQTYQFDTAFSQSQQSSSLNSFGRACFQSTVIGGDVVGTTNNVGWLTGTPGNLDWVARKNDYVVVTGGNNPGLFAIGALGFNCPINLVGQVLHDERLLTAGTPPTGASLALSTNDNCILLYSPGNGNVVIVREGDQAAGMPAGALYGSPTPAQGFGVLGKCGFQSTMTGAVAATNDTALFIGDSIACQNVQREGDPAPGLPAGVFFGTANSSAAYSDYEGGSLAFYSTLAGAVTAFNDTSVWLGRPGTLQLIAREGEPAPGFENNPGYVSATFGDTNTGSGGISAGSVQLNDRGQINFSGVPVTVVDGAGTTVLSSCNYSWDPTTGLKLLFARNDVFPSVGLGPQPTFSAAGIQFPSGEGCPLSMSNDGDVALRVGFSNGNGQGAIVRAKLGALDGGPSAISATLGGTHTMKLDAGVANAGGIYVVVATASGTRPGFSFGGKLIPLNFDAVTQLSLDSLTFYPGSPWGTTLGLLDGNGRGTATLTLPPGLPQLAGIDVDHAMAVIDLGLNVQFVSPPCGVLLY